MVCKSNRNCTTKPNAVCPQEAPFMRSFLGWPSQSLRDILGKKAKEPSDRHPSLWPPGAHTRAQSTCHQAHPVLLHPPCEHQGVCSYLLSLEQADWNFPLLPLVYKILFIQFGKEVDKLRENPHSKFGSLSGRVLSF